LGEALNKFDFLALVSGDFDGLQVVVGMLQLARRGGCDSRGGAEFGDEVFVPDVHCNLREKAGQILENSRHAGSAPGMMKTVLRAIFLG
jgi:hypothetical protein